MNHITRPDSHAALYILAGIGLASTLLYALGLAVCYPLTVGIQHPLASWATLAGYAWPASMVLALVYTLLFGYYMLALRLVSFSRHYHERRLLIVIIGSWLLASGVLVWVYPGESLDIFDYLFRGRMQVVAGVSPLAITPAPFAGQRFFQYVNWLTYVDTYGPLWEYASGAVAAIVGLLAPAAALATYIIAYRLLAISLAGLCGILVYRIVRHHSPQHAPAALLAWFWNPLLLTATAIGAHNDMLMLLALLGALLLFQRQHWLLGLLALALAAHVKLTGLLLLPVLGLWLARRVGWWRALRISGAAAVLMRSALVGAVCAARRLGDAATHVERAGQFDCELAGICRLLGAANLCWMVGDRGLAHDHADCDLAVLRRRRNRAAAVLARHQQAGRAR